MSKSNQERYETKSYIFCLSYGVPVVAFWKEKNIFIVTGKWWSKTTSKHINAFVNYALARDGGEVVEWAQEDLDKIFNRAKAYTICYSS